VTFLVRLGCRARVTDQQTEPALFDSFGETGTMRCRASFRVVTHEGSSAGITQVLGLPPTTSHEVGDPVGRVPGNIRKHAQWTLSTDMREPSELTEHLVELLDRVEPVQLQLEQLRTEGCEIDWFCFVAAKDTEHAVELPASVLVRVAAFGPLLIDTYGNDDDT
jgi:hypothetical protein